MVGKAFLSGRNQTSCFSMPSDKARGLDTFTMEFCKSVGKLSSMMWLFYSKNFTQMDKSQEVLTQPLSLIPKKRSPRIQDFRPISLITAPIKS